LTERFGCRHPLDLRQCFRGRPSDRYQFIRQIPLVSARRPPPV
jgi:hypothetical protein